MAKITGRKKRIVITTAALLAISGGALSPGGAGQTVNFTVTNPATGNQKLTAVTVAVAEAAGATWNDVPGCSAADYSVGAPVITYGDMAADAEVTGTVTITMNNLGTNQDACKAATVPLHFVAS